MSAEMQELVRALSLACRRINPPHNPNIGKFSLAELAADMLAGQLEKPEWRYAYLRGLDEQPSQDKTGPAGPWPLQGGHTGPVTALTTLADGRIVSGSDDNTLRVWRETTSGEWESEVIAAAENFLRLLAWSDQLISTYEAVMLWTLPPTGLPRKRQRLFAAGGAFSVTDFDDDGSVKTVRITPTEPDRLWQTTANPDSPGGKPLPCDPLLHRYASFYSADGQHAEVWEVPDQFSWEGLTEQGARTLVLFSKPQEPAAPNAI